MVQKLLLTLVLGLPLFTCAQGFNGGFESLAPNGIPNGWSIADPSGAATTKDAHLGKVAAKAWVANNYKAGIWTSKSDPSEGNASEVSGYYKYLGERAECNRATVSYLLGARNPDGNIDTLAYGDTELKLSKDYRKFSLSISSQRGGTPEFASVQFQPSGHCNEHGASNCCFLFVDDIVLAGRTSLQSEPTDPEPAEETPAHGTEMEEEDAGGIPTTPVLENKGGTETEEVPVEEEAPVEEASPAEETATPEEEAVPVEEEVVPVEEEPSESVDEEWNSEEASDGGK